MRSQSPNSAPPGGGLAHLSGDRRPVTAPPPFFVADGDRFVPSASTRGPWSARHQHGGPPAALLARAFAREVGPAALVARLTFDFLRPVPVAPLTVATRVVRAGGKVQRLAGRVLAEDGAVLIEATCLGVRLAPESIAVAPETPEPPPPPPESAPFEIPLMSGDAGYHRAMEWRLARGPWGLGPAAAWLRPRVPLVAGETPSPLECLVVAADSASGVAVVLDPARATFVNGDLTIALHRPPIGDWTCLDAAVTGEPHGVGLARARLWDTAGLVGRSLQMLLLEPRA
ncbi:MAG TPA: thioesterase family protein [Methylomirabilota bacterium]|nr:thioesterase family protein [Methylomirabilota bacterium]